MIAVMTIDQRGSRRDVDRVGEVLSELGRDIAHDGVLLPFERTVGDEVQGVISDAALVVELALRCSRAKHWTVGIGFGTVRTPLPASTRAASGSAFEHARAAVNRAKASPESIAVLGSDPILSRYVEAVLSALAALVRRRSPAGWEAVDMMAEGRSRGEVAARLGISKQAVSQRLHTAWWWHEQQLRPVAAHLITEAA